MAQLAIVDALLAAGASVDAVNGQKSTALSIVAGRGDGEVAARLLRHGADPNAANDEGKTPLVDAADKGYHEVVAALLAGGANPDGSGKGVYKRWTPLMSAASEGHAKIARALLDAGAEYGATDADGLDARAWAKKHGKEEVVLELAGHRVRMKRKAAAEKEL